MHVPAGCGVSMNGSAACWYTVPWRLKSWRIPLSETPLWSLCHGTTTQTAVWFSCLLSLTNHNESILSNLKNIYNYNLSTILGKNCDLLVIWLLYNCIYFHIWVIAVLRCVSVIPSCNSKLPLSSNLIIGISRRNVDKNCLGGRYFWNDVNCLQDAFFIRICWGITYSLAAGLFSGHLPLVHSQLQRVQVLLQQRERPTEPQIANWWPM